VGRALWLALVTVGVSALAACGDSRPDAPRARSVLFVTLDTTRRDALGMYGGKPGVSPNLDAFAREAVVYERCSAVAPLTLPSHASMLTGLYPPRHTVHINSMQAVPQSAETLAEQLQAAGYDTSAFVGAVVLDQAFGLAQGFDVYGSPSAPKVQETISYDERPARAVGDEALAWFRARDRSKPFFSWLHFYDAHLPYQPPTEFKDQAGKNAYLGEIAYVDHVLQEVFALLNEQGLWDDLLVIVTADHGDSLGQHNEDTHGPLAYETTIAVPLLVRWPGAVLANTRDTTLTSVADVYPTVLECLDLPLKSDIDGASLWQIAATPRSGVYVEALYGYHAFRWSQLIGWRSEEGKYLHSARPEYYDVDVDPNETSNVIAAHAAAVERAKQDLRALYQRSRLEVTAADEVDGSMLGKIAMLGYIGTGSKGGLVAGDGSDPLDTGDRPAPVDCMERYVLSTVAQSHLFANQGTSAIPLLERVIQGEPRNPNALFQYSSALIQARRPAQALKAVEDALKYGDPWYGLYRNKGMCLDALGRTEEALEAYHKALAFEPDLTTVWARLAELAKQRGDLDEWKRCHDRAVELGLPVPGEPRPGEPTVQPATVPPGSPPAVSPPSGSPPAGLPESGPVQSGSLEPPPPEQWVVPPRGH
jgi:arylsulfatase A-like enzyme/Flp pilus assembly protein TadD